MSKSNTAVGGERRRIAIAIGDPNGIGPEIALKAAAAHLGDGAIQPVLVGDVPVLAHYRKLLGIAATLSPLDAARPDTIAVADVMALEPAHFAPGRMSPEAGRATIAYATEASTFGSVSALTKASRSFLSSAFPCRNRCAIFSKPS